MDPTLGLRKIMLRDLRAFARELVLFPDEAALWSVVPGISNSAGNLALHVAGNLQHFIGQVLGGSDYLRDREREFAQRSGSREELLALLGRAEAAVESVLPDLDEQALASPYPAAPGGLAVPTGTWLLHLTAHLAFHLGQIGMLRRALTGSAATSGAMGLQELA
jgi:uncharacterized damage-inducible protein DinB